MRSKDVLVATHFCFLGPVVGAGRSLRCEALLLQLRHLHVDLAHLRLHFTEIFLQAKKVKRVKTLVFCFDSLLLLLLQK